MTVGLMIELLVAFLLVLTIGYCVTLNRRLKRLRNDEEALRATIAELITATEIAERAILGLKATAGDCDKNLAHRLKEAERLASDLQYYVNQGEGVVGRLVKISEAVREPETMLHSHQSAELDHARMLRSHTAPGQPHYTAMSDLKTAPAVDPVARPRSLQDVAAATSERLSAIRQRRGGVAA